MPRKKKGDRFTLQKEFQPRQKKMKPNGPLPITNIHPDIHERGDDTRFTPSFVRAKGTVPGDFRANVDPSSLTNKVPENDPPLGQVDHPAAAAIQEDQSQEAAAEDREGDVDNVSAMTNTAQLGATLPSSRGNSQVNLSRQAHFANESKSTKEGVMHSQPSLNAQGAEKGIEEAKTTHAPTDSAVVPQVAQKAASSDTLRPLFGLANPLAVVPSTRDQIKSGVMFNDFSIVAPGFGLGVTNKLFRMNDLRDRKIRYHGPLALPRSDDGPTNTVLPPPLEFQNHITTEDIQREVADKLMLSTLGKQTRLQAGEGSLNTLGDDYGFLRNTSAKGLPRAPDSPLEPIILKPTPTERVRLLAGSQLSTREPRRLFDAQRYPEHFQSRMAQEGGSHFSRRNALRLYPFPVGMA